MCVMVCGTSCLPHLYTYLCYLHSIWRQIWIPAQISSWVSLLLNAKGQTVLDYQADTTVNDRLVEGYLEPLRVTLVMGYSQ